MTPALALPPGPLSALAALQASPAWLALAAAGASYAWGVHRAGRWPRARSLAFATALAALALALAPSIDAAAEQRLSLHMVQHLLISMVAAPLAVWSAPVRLLLRAQGPPARRRTARALHAPALRALAHPLAGLALFVGVGVAAHVPAVYEAALGHPALHAVEHAAFFWSAVALWSPLIAADPLPRRV
ncbi:MAG: cytochrome c oxidase assembly protein, partial [Thermoleophilaceae bacterium]